MNSGRSYARKSSSVWTWYGFDRARRKVVAFVNERRTDAACQKLLKKLSGCQISRYYTDDWQSYKSSYTKQHCVSKAETRHNRRHT
jgi:insertion element IS1 protein InsB